MKSSDPFTLPIRSYSEGFRNSAYSNDVGKIQTSTCCHCDSPDVPRAGGKAGRNREILETGETLREEAETLNKYFDRYDFFYIHFKKTDSAGEDGNFKLKVKALEEIDRVIPSIVRLKPDVSAVTGDHSTPSLLKGHSWHPNPISSPFGKYIRPEGIRRFTERHCRRRGNWADFQPRM